MHNAGTDNRIDLPALTQSKPLYLFCFVCLEQIILDSVGHKRRKPQVGDVVKKNKLLILKERPEFPLVAPHNFWRVSYQ